MVNSRPLEGAPAAAEGLQLRIIKLALPILAVQVSVIAFAFLDTVMASHRSASELAVVGLAGSVYISVLVAATGVLLAVQPLVAQRYGSSQFAGIGVVVVQGFWLALFLSVPAGAIFLFPDFVLRAVSTPDPLVGSVRTYLTGCALGLPAVLLFRVFYAFQTAVCRPKVVMAINLAALTLKVPLNLLALSSVGAQFGLSGAEGFSYASAAVSWLSIGIAGVVMARAPAAGAAFGLRWQRPRWSQQKGLLDLGIPISLAQVAEVTSFTAMALLVARKGADALAAHQVAANLATTLFMVPLSLSLATSVLVAQAVGAREPETECATVSAGLRVTSTCALALMVALMLFRAPLARSYSDTRAVSELCSALLAWVAISQIGDALQVYYGSVLRAYGSTRPAMIVSLTARWLIGLLGGYWLAYGSPQLGVQGFWSGSGAGLAVAAVLLAIQYRRTRDQRVGVPSFGPA